MDSHFKKIPGFTSFTTWRLARSDFQALGRKAHGSFNTKVLRLGTFDELGADLLEGFNIARGEGDANLMDFLCRNVCLVTEDHDTGWSN